MAVEVEGNDRKVNLIYYDLEGKLVTEVYGLQKRVNIIGLKISHSLHLIWPIMI